MVIGGLKCEFYIVILLIRHLSVNCSMICLGIKRVMICCSINVFRWMRSTIMKKHRSFMLVPPYAAYLYAFKKFAYIGRIRLLRMLTSKYRS